MSSAVTQLSEFMSRTSPITFKRLLESYGLRGPIEATMAMSLGTPEATVGEMVSGYTTFVNDGVRVDPVMVTQIEDMQGEKPGGIWKGIPTR